MIYCAKLNPWQFEKSLKRHKLNEKEKKNFYPFFYFLEGCEKSQKKGKIAIIRRGFLKNIYRKKHKNHKKNEEILFGNSKDPNEN